MNTSTLGSTEQQKVPMKVNALKLVQGLNSQLLPLFPYMGPGSIVPCCAAFESDGSGTPIGYFLHENTVDEVAVTVASNGQVRTGDVHVGPKLHGVGGMGKDPFYALMVITQRQLEEGEQTEAVGFQCEKCATMLHRHEFDEAAGGDGALAGLPTIFGSEAAALGYNASEEVRTCSQCGHVNPPFPLYIWGWSNYSRNTRIVREAEKAMAAIPA